MATTATPPMPPPLTTTSSRRMGTTGRIFGILFIIVALGGGIIFLRGCNRGDGVPLNQEMKISQTLKQPLELNDGSVVDGRIFLFTDRNGPIGPSVVWPLRNKAGVELVRRDLAVTPGTMKFVDIEMPEQVIDLVRHPGGTVRVVYFNVHRLEPQVVDPTPMIPRKSRN